MLLLSDANLMFLFQFTLFFADYFSTLYMACINTLNTSALLNYNRDYDK